MPIPSGDRVKQTAEAEHIGPDYTGDNISAKKVAGYSWNSDTSSWERTQTTSGKVSTENSTTTLLDIDEVFTGQWVETLGYSEIIVTISAVGANSATDGLRVEWSMDGVDVHDADVFTITASSSKTFSFPCQAQYMRVKYTNDGVAQTDFHLQTLLKRYASKGSSHRLKDALVQEDDAIVTKSLITGFSTAGGGQLVNVKVNPSGAIQVSGDITTTPSTLADFAVNDIEEGTTSYFGNTKPDGTWLIKKLTDTSVGYATVTNNGAVTSYTDAWTNRATLTYGRFDEAF